MKNEIQNTTPRGYLRVFGYSYDEESRECWWIREATFPLREQAEAREFALRATRETGRKHIVRGPGQPKPKDRPMNETELSAAWATVRESERAEGGA